MSIERADFDQLSEADLLELVTAGVPEGLRIEYKAMTYGATDGDRKEFAKDISALANTQGGHLLIGVVAEEGVAARVEGLKAVDVDQELQRLEQIAGSGLEPRISGLRMKAVRLADGSSVIVIRIPRSWNPPHRVIAQRSNRFYARNSAGVYEPNVEELRPLFTQSASALEQVRRFVAARIDTALMEQHRPLVGNGRLFLHIVPVASLSGAITVDLQAVHARHQALRPIGGGFGYSPRFNYYGFVNERGNDNDAYTMVLRNGAIEAACGDVLIDHDKHKALAGLALEREIRDVLASYINALRDVGVPPPVVVAITFEGVRGAHYVVSNNPGWDGWPPPIPHDRTSLPECIIEDYGDELQYHRAVRPAFDALWNAAGRPRAATFDAEGRWTDKVR